MNLADIIILSFVLGIDCFIVSFSQGLVFKSDRGKNCLKLAFSMGAFQALMPVIGYVGINEVYSYIMPYSKHIVFGIFFILGIHFILEGITDKQKCDISAIGIKCLVSLGIATSIDALLSGTTLRLTSSNLLVSCLLFGLVSFFLSIAGFWSGNYIKNIPSKYLQILGGIILILLALKATL